MGAGKTPEGETARRNIEAGAARSVMSNLRIWWQPFSGASFLTANVTVSTCGPERHCVLHRLSSSEQLRIGRWQAQLGMYQAIQINLLKYLCDQ